MVFVDEDITWIRVSLTACGESVYIDLSEELDLGLEEVENFEKYMIVFNNNNGSVSLRIRGETVATSLIGNLISCEDERDFVIEWSNTELWLGHSSIRGENKLLHYLDDYKLNLTINAISVHDDHRQDKGWWRIYQNVGMYSVLNNLYKPYIYRYLCYFATE